MADDRNRVPCNGCKACCKREHVILSPEHGDVVEQYQRTPSRLHINGAPTWMLAHKSNGDCVYLMEHGCGIWNYAPWACRQFDCRKWYLGFPDAMQELLDVDDLDGEVVKAARARLPYE